MSLVGFHRFLITTAILFCAAFAGWQYTQFSRTEAGGSLAVAVVFAVLAVGLGVYLARLDDFLGREPEG